MSGNETQFMEANFGKAGKTIWTVAKIASGLAAGLVVIGGV